MPLLRPRPAKGKDIQQWGNDELGMAATVGKTTGLSVV